MAYLDYWWDPVAGYVFDESDQNDMNALRHETRTSVWYAVGLLARNEGDDVVNAERVLTQVIQGQYKDENEQWFATYTQEPEEPMVGAPEYPPEIYQSWDPNWRGFIGTSLIIALEEYSHLLNNDVQELVLESLVNNTIGDSWRVGGVDGDNLYPCYSNPSIMRAFVASWTGRRLNITNTTLAGEKYAADVVALFNNTGTLPEFNSPTYFGVSLYGLTLWCKYMPVDSILKQNAKRIIQATYESVGELWHPGMRNIAGPWDRLYGWDMNKYFAVMAAWLWLFIGKEKAGVFDRIGIMSHNSDFAFGPLIAILAETHVKMVPEAVQKRLSAFQGEHMYTAQAYSPPYDYAYRNYTTWISENVTIGAVSFDQDVVGGSSVSPGSWTPAAIQWYTGDPLDVGFIVNYPTEAAIEAKVSRGTLNLTYPYGNSSSIFSLLLSPPSLRATTRTVSSWADADALDVKVTTFPEMPMNLTFAGHYGGAESLFHDFEYYNFTYTLPMNFSGQPSIQLEVQLK
ncbi:hypothetical protein EJ03DRAFT_350452 [Teratosphaeria nubilosa]|uniref:Uncharacterized protein n=1 Tax=Teratosphaeria nubilosa TaxID=161662 RepID=A0A6G1LBQ9_9PEZI|nr:hypothetical protein EJ03DRAFT_350452 [Teratosphaeria nubilosa]